MAPPHGYQPLADGSEPTPPRRIPFFRPRSQTQSEDRPASRLPRSSTISHIPRRVSRRSSGSRLPNSSTSSNLIPSPTSNVAPPPTTGEALLTPSGLSSSNLVRNADVVKGVTRLQRRRHSNQFNTSCSTRTSDGSASRHSVGPMITSPMHGGSGFASPYSPPIKSSTHKAKKSSVQSAKAHHVAEDPGEITSKPLPRAPPTGIDSQSHLPLLASFESMGISSSHESQFSSSMVYAGTLATPTEPSIPLSISGGRSSHAVVTASPLRSIKAFQASQVNDSTDSFEQNTSGSAEKLDVKKNHECRPDDENSNCPFCNDSILGVNSSCGIFKKDGPVSERFWTGRFSSARDMYMAVKGVDLFEIKKTSKKNEDVTRELDLARWVFAKLESDYKTGAVFKSLARYKARWAIENNLEELINMAPLRKQASVYMERGVHRERNFLNKVSNLSHNNFSIPRKPVRHPASAPRGGSGNAHGAGNIGKENGRYDFYSLGRDGPTVTSMNAFGGSGADDRFGFDGSRPFRGVSDAQLTYNESNTGDGSKLPKQHSGFLGKLKDIGRKVSWTNGSAE